MSARSLTVLLALLLLALLLLAACSPLGGDDDDEARTDGDPPPTREVIISTFTATEVVPPEQATSTAQAKETAAVATATAAASIPTPTANPVPTGEELSPPQGRLTVDGQQYEGATGSSAWQYDDAAGTFAVIQAPVVFLNDEFTVSNSSQFSLDIYGDAYRVPPEEIEVAAYDYEANRGTPVNPQTGQPAEGEAFAIKVDPLMSMMVDPAEPTFTLEDLPPGHYALWVQGRWGMHPNIPDQPIFATWLFNVVVS